MRTGKRVWVFVAAASCALLVAGYLDGASPSTPPKPSTTTPPKPPVKTWGVVEVKSWNGVISYDVVESTGMKARTARLLSEYKQALAKWKKDKILADINSTKFDTPKPVLGYVRRVQTTPPSFRYPDLARAMAAVLTKKLKEREKEAAENRASSTPDDGKNTEPSKPREPPSGKVVTPAETDDNDTETDAPEP
jgi:hypothetical protein